MRINEFMYLLKSRLQVLEFASVVDRLLNKDIIQTCEVHMEIENSQFLNNYLDTYKCNDIFNSDDPFIDDKNNFV